MCKPPRRWPNATSTRYNTQTADEDSMPIYIDRRIPQAKSETLLRGPEPAWLAATAGEILR